MYTLRHTLLLGTIRDRARSVLIRCVGLGRLFLHLRVLQFHAILARKLGAAVRERRRLVGLFGVQLALVIGQRQWSAILDQLEQAILNSI